MREFIADAKKSRLDTDPLTGEEIEKIVVQLFKIERDSRQPAERDTEISVLNAACAKYRLRRNS